jgi:fumarate hydratase class II
MIRSSNDSFPIATRVTAALRIVQELVPAPGELHGVLRSNEKTFPRVGRGTKRTRVAVAELYPLTQRISAIGSGLDPRSSFACLFVRHVASMTPAPPASSRHVHPTTRSSAHRTISVARCSENHTTITVDGGYGHCELSVHEDRYLGIA